jgi:hypothetical protein
MVRALLGKDLGEKRERALLGRAFLGRNLGKKLTRKKMSGENL